MKNKDASGGSTEDHWTWLDWSHSGREGSSAAAHWGLPTVLSFGSECPKPLTLFLCCFIFTIPSYCLRIVNFVITSGFP